MLDTTLLATSPLEARIHEFRGLKVMIDADLAELYGVTTKRLNEQVLRNIERFPLDFRFQLSDEEFGFLRSQFATSKNPSGRGGRRHLPYVFTEHGAIMAASVLNSPQAIETSVYVVRAFVRIRELISTHKELSHKLDELERKVMSHDQAITGLIHAIRELMTPPATRKRPIGFGRNAEE